MRRLILASRSKARQALLKQIGVKFTVSSALVDERHSLKHGCRKLVIANALDKARAVAGRYGSGIVIAADTIVLAGKRLIGKPRDMGDAVRTLRYLSRTPQQVWSGIVLIDIDHGRVLSDAVCTKVYMRRLSDADILAYFKLVSPLDKAGAFDIQRYGALFIERIDGCFYNVVGLPLARLTTMLKKLGVDILETKR